MKNPKTAVNVLVANAISLAFAYNVQAQEVGDPIPGSYICVFFEGVSGVNAKANAAASNAGGHIQHVYENALPGFSIRIADPAVTMLVERNPEIAYCEQDQYVGIPRPVPNTQSYSAAPGGGGPGGGGGGPGGGGSGGGGKGGGGKQPPAQTVPWGVDLVGGPGDGTGKTAWLIDTGIDLDHPDLNVDVARSISFLDGDASPDDANGHGTHVAGTIAALDNTIGVVGVAAGASVVSVRALNRRGIGPDSGVIAAFDYLAGGVALPGDVINLSVVLDNTSTALDQAIANVGLSGIYVVSGAGNSIANANNYSPARANGVNVYTAAAIDDASGNWASYSNYGAPPIDFAEPGSNIPSLDKNGGYTTKSGTSMAAPHLSGILLVNNGVVNAGAMTTTDTHVGQTYPVGVK